MGSRLGGGDDDVISDINITPFVDIILVVLIIFMVTTSAIVESSIKINLPDAATGEATENISLGLTLKTDGALLAAYDHEIRSLKRTVSQAEEDGLVLVGEAEELEREIEERGAALEDSRSTFAEFRGNVEKEIAEAESRLAALNEAQAQRSSSEISSEHLTLYRRILKTREGEAMAELSGQICQACFVEIPKNVAVRLARGVELVQCPSCDRILHVPH